MKKKELTFNEALTKINMVYPADCYVIHNHYILPGPESEAALTSNHCFSIATLRLSEGLHQVLKNESIAYIANIRKAKDELKKYVKVIQEDEVYQRLLRIQENELLQFQKVEGWKNLELPEEQSNQLFSDNAAIELFKDDPTTPTLLIAKKALPILTEKNYRDVVYEVHQIKDGEDIEMSSDHEFDGVYKITFNILGEFLQFITSFLYMDLDFQTKKQESEE